MFEYGCFIVFACLFFLIYCCVWLMCAEVFRMCARRGLCWCFCSVVLRPTRFAPTAPVVVVCCWRSMVLSGLRSYYI